MMGNCRVGNRKIGRREGSEKADGGDTGLEIGVACERIWIERTGDQKLGVKRNSEVGCWRVKWLGEECSGQRRLSSSRRRGDE